MRARRVLAALGVTAAVLTGGLAADTATAPPAAAWGEKVTNDKRSTVAVSVHGVRSGDGGSFYIGVLPGGYIYTPTARFNWAEIPAGRCAVANIAGESNGYAGPTQVWIPFGASVRIHIWRC